MEQIEIPVEAKCGLFSECVVTLELATREKVTLIADASLITRIGEQQTLRVYAVDSPSNGQSSIKVLLPTEAIEMETRWVTIHNPSFALV